ncbi:calcium-binding protein [Paracoccus sp. M683]|uniref:calcium-binding protein n=1 Tax=Paracoccus sp. M683 TaxID=2594268 RepID=UPI00118101A7|nr:calcium-binding protein [Paracoccus sp. M683]TRW92845.1 calcium-binding protein [Paracoccus sp. M683]
MPDTGPSRLLSVDAPSVLDLRAGQVQAIFAASVSDPDGVQQVTVYFDRPLATETGAYAFQIIHGWGADWADGSHSYAAQVLPHNIGGTLNITHVEITDNLGNRTTVSGPALRGLGVDTSITIQSTDPDRTAPELTSLDLPDRVDLRNGNVMAEFWAAGSDVNQVSDIAIIFDRDIAVRYGSAGSYSFNNVTFSPGEVNGSAFREITAANYSGTVDIRQVWITDEYGNRRIYTNDQLRELGFDTSFELIGAQAPTPTTYVAAFPETITLREGQTANLALNFVGMTNHWVSYSYYTTTSGGTADAGDTGATSGNGYLSLASTFPTTRQQSFTISTTRDGVMETTETAYLVIELSGNMTFPDGGTMQVVEIRITDDNRITGGAGRDVLYGTSGVDTLTGGAGNDVYHVTLGDLVVETTDGGIDTVHSAFSRAIEANIENLTLTGSGHINGNGNVLANLLVGNAGNNVLNGGIGADTMRGGSGNDTYVVDNLGDVVSEGWNAGNDRVLSSVSYTLGAHVENLTLTGLAHLNGTGNALANQILGNAGNNILNGGVGADTMQGGAGNDTYIVDNIGDRVVEGLNGGVDRVQSSVSFTLGANVENMTLTGMAHINGTGNVLANQIIGNAGNNLIFAGLGNDNVQGGAGNDTLHGGLGNDILIGGAGADRIIGGQGADRMTGSAGADVFVFQTLADSTTAVAGRDVITDFSFAQGDLIDLSALDARTNVAGNQAFSFVGTGGFTGNAGELAYRSVAGGTLIVADVNGDRIADLAILLDDSLTLNANSFIL